ncbi:MAG TPA: hypothetical protein VFC00_08850 [Micromonosporaceae bacterium]|nr:hypothetical protein [Micromonosporaceae bacterium]
MLSSPVWRGSAKYAFCGGLLLGAVTTAAGLVLVGSFVRLAAPPAVWRWVLLAAVAALLLRELGLVRFWLPQNARQVPEHVRRHGRFFGPLRFGFEVGTGVRTYAPSALPYGAALAVLLLAGPLAALTAGLGFGLGRSAMTLGNLAYSNDNSWDSAWIAHERVARFVLATAFAVGIAVLSL